MPFGTVPPVNPRAPPARSSFLPGRMNRRLALLLYGLAACVQLLVAWLVYAQHPVHPQAPTAAVAARPAEPAGPGLGVVQPSRRP